MTETCANCMWSRPNPDPDDPRAGVPSGMKRAPTILCVRMPATVVNWIEHWCGEYLRKKDAA